MWKLVAILVVLFILLWLHKPRGKIGYNVIHLSSNLERRKNIKNMQKILELPIETFDAVTYVTDRTLNKIKQSSRLIFNKREVACYKSHQSLIKNISKSFNEYEVIFEDDFAVDSDTKSKVEQLVEDFPNFDLLFIGSNNEKYKGDHVSGIVYNVEDDKFLPGAHAYIVKTKSANKVFDCLQDITCPIDVKFHEEIKNGNIQGYITYPSIVGIQPLKSTIGH